MIRSKIIGGLGNQLFQFSCARALAEDLNQSLVLDISGFQKYKLRQPLILKFDLPKNIAVLSNKQLSLILDVKDKSLGRYYKEKQIAFDPVYTMLKKPATLRGYFQSEMFFSRHADIIRSELKITSVKSMSIRQSWRCEIVAALHFRRGDYLNEADFGLCSKDYYLNGMSMLRAMFPGIKFVAFTDDPDWFFRESDLSDEVICASGQGLTDLEEFSLMMSCDHFVIANSSYSWWAAWLGGALGKKVIAPSPWFISDQHDCSSIVPENWIKLDRYGLT
ncbi:alpha-1,2-fucosyltransferase [Nereida sp.]|uniref:alpha-1,2-fucosyltransferase n=1 Tax=Nereida sp. TaxID=2736090 RepID=UPI003F699275